MLYFNCNWCLVQKMYSGHCDISSSGMWWIQKILSIRGSASKINNECLVIGGISLQHLFLKPLTPLDVKNHTYCLFCLGTIKLVPSFASLVLRKLKKNPLVLHSRPSVSSGVAYWNKWDTHTSIDPNKQWPTRNVKQTLFVHDRICGSKQFNISTVITILSVWSEYTQTNVPRIFAQ